MVAPPQCLGILQLMRFECPRRAQTCLKSNGTERDTAMSMQALVSANAPVVFPMQSAALGGVSLNGIENNSTQRP